MYLEEKINNKRSEIKDILLSWGFRLESEAGTRKLADIYSWFRNFELSEFEDAFLILSKIKHYTEHDTNLYIGELSKLLKAEFNEDLSKVIFFPLGLSPSSSGASQ